MSEREMTPEQVLANTRTRAESDAELIAGSATASIDPETNRVTIAPTERQLEKIKSDDPAWKEAFMSKLNALGSICERAHMYDHARSVRGEISEDMGVDHDERELNEAIENAQKDVNRGLQKLAKAKEALDKL